MADQPSTTAAAVQKRPLLYVYTLDVDPTLYSFSPFAVKLRLRLRHGGVPYEDRMGGLSGMPKGKIPYVQFLPQTDGDGKGEFMGDSGLVTDRLVKEGKLPDCNGELSAVDRVRDLCLRKLLEDNLYWLVVSFSPLFLVKPSLQVESHMAEDTQCLGGKATKKS